MVTEQPSDLSECTRFVIEDRYLVGTRLRLRKVLSNDNAIQYKLCKKYPSTQPNKHPIVNVYLDDAEYHHLAQLPHHLLKKTRYHLSAPEVTFAIDVFQDELSGLTLCEYEIEHNLEPNSVNHPSWFSLEVTDDPFFQGGSLCQISRETLWAKLKNLQPH